MILSPHLRADNVAEILAAARGLRTREVEILAAGLAPRPDYTDFMRALPAPVPAENDPRELIEPLSERRFLFRFSASSELRRKYERVRELLGAARAGGSMEAVVEAGLEALLHKLDPGRRLARRTARKARRAVDGRAADEAEDTPALPFPAMEEAVKRDVPPLRSRRIVADLRDAVRERDGGRCTFVGPDGERCPATSRLEIDHIRPYALGGPSDDAANLRVMCRAHNQLLARRIFGAAIWPRPGISDYPQG